MNTLANDNTDPERAINAAVVAHAEQQVEQFATDFAESPRLTDVADLKAVSWQRRVYDHPVSPQFHAMLACALGKAPRTNAKYVSKVTVTSDGFMMGDFVTSEDEYKPGAFVGAFSDYKRNVEGLGNHLIAHDLLSDEEHKAFLEAAQAWIGQDYSGRANITTPKEG